MRFILNLARELISLKKIWINRVCAYRRVLSSKEAFSGVASSEVKLELELFDEITKRNSGIPKADKVFLENSKWLAQKRSDFFSQMTSALDVGCGSGVYEPVLRSLNSDLHYIGLENSIINHPNGISVWGDARQLPLRDKSIDLSLLSGVIHCLPMDWKAVLLEARRVSRHYICLLRVPVILRDHPIYYQLIVSNYKQCGRRFLAAFNTAEFESFILENRMTIIEKSRAKESFDIEGYPDRVFMHRYLLKI